MPQNNLLRDTSIYVLVKFFVGILGLYSLPILNSSLPNRDLALLGIVWVLVPLLFRLFSLGTDVGFSIGYLNFNSMRDTFFTHSLVPFLLLSLIFSFAYLFMQFTGSDFFEVNFRLKLLIIVYFLLSGILNHFGNYAALSKDVFWNVSLSNIPFIMTSLTLVIFRNIDSLGDYLITWCFAAIVLITAYVVNFKNLFSLRLKGLKSSLSILINSGISSIPGGIFVFILVGADRFMLEGKVSILELAAYVLFYRITESTILTVITAFNKSFYPRWLALNHGTNRVEWDSLLIKAALALLSLSISLLIIVVPLINWLMYHFFSDKYIVMNSELTFQILIVNILIVSATSLIGNIFIQKDKLKSTLLPAGISAFLNILLNYLLIPPYGILGASIASALSYILNFLLVVGILDLKLVKYFAPSTLAIIALLFLNYLHASSIFICIIIMVFSIISLKKIYNELDTKV